MYILLLRLLLRLLLLLLSLRLRLLLLLLLLTCLHWFTSQVYFWDFVCPCKERGTGTNLHFFTHVH